MINKKNKIKIVFSTFKLLILSSLLSIFLSCRDNDITPPEIYLVGSSDTIINQYEAFEEPGYSAFDDRDGDITSFVSIKGQIDESVAKIYTLQYKVSDKAGNFALKVRTVTVKAQ